MEYMVDRRYKISVICIALLVHFCLLTPLFVTHWQAHDISQFSYADHIADDVPVIFQNPSQSTPMPPDTEWANLKARASTLGSPDFADEIPATEDFSTLAENDHNKTQESSEIQRSEPTPVKEPTSLITSDQSHHQKEQNNEKSGSSSSNLAKAVAAQSLAHFTKGYLEQLHHEGDNLVNMIGGNSNKRPTAEQLKHERYWAKIQWCIQNSFAINRERYLPNKPIHTTLQIFFTVNRQGKMHELKITQSSGHRDLDNFMIYAFNYASSSFPPLPTYITQDPYPIMYTIEVIPSNEVPWRAFRSD